MMIFGDDPLAHFLRYSAQRPFAWGTWDCLMWLADWIKERRDVDPGEDWRGSYTSALGAAKIIKQAGGMVGHVARCVRPFGIVRTLEFQRGDIAVLAAPEGEIGAILHGGTASCLMEKGLLVRRLVDVPVIAAWRV